MKLFFLLSLFSSLGLHGQVLEGRIFDVTNQAPIQAAAILNLSDSSGVTTDNKGRFQINVSSLPVEILITHLGYKPKFVILKNRAFKNISLQATEQHLNEVIVNATQFKARIIDVPTAVQALTSQDLQRNNESVIVPIINRLPGVFMESGSLNTNRLAIRGIGSRTPFATNRVRVYFNDIPLTTGEGESTIEDIDLNSLQRVEVIRGPASGVYGAGLGGTINLISTATDYLDSEVSAKTIIGSYGLQNHQLKIANSGENGFINLNLNDLNSEGYRENSEYKRKSAIISGSLYGDENFTVSFLGSFIDLKAFIPSSIGKTAFEEDPSSAAFTWDEAQGFESYIKSFGGISISNKITNRISAYSSGFLSFRDAYEPRPFNILDENTVAAGFRSRLEYQSEGASPVSLQVGTEIFTDWYSWSTYENLYESIPDQGSVQGEILSDNDEKRSYYNIFLQGRIEFSRLIVEGGINLNSTDYDLTDAFNADGLDQSGSYEFDPVLSPRLGFVYKVRQNWNLFGTVSHGFSMPSLEETLTPEGRINPDIQPEKGLNFEMGAKGHWLDQQLSGELTIYHMRIEDLLVAERIGPDQYVGINAGKTIHNGIELYLQYNLSFNHRWRFQPYLSITQTDYRFEEFINRETDYSGNQISGFPDNIVNLGLDLKSTHGIYFYNDLRYVGRAFLNDENTLQNESYVLLNSKVGYKAQFKSGIYFDVNVGVNNVWDEKYASMVLVNAVGFGSNEPRYFYPGLPRNYYMGLNVGYIF